MTGALRVCGTDGVIGWSPLEKDAFLYLGSAIFAALTAVVAVSADYREWGEMAGVAYGARCRDLRRCAGVRTAAAGWRRTSICLAARGWCWSASSSAR